MKKLILGLALSMGSFVITAHSESINQKFIIQNTSNTDYIVNYETCIIRNVEYMPTECLNNNQLKINSQSSNFSNPIKVNLIKNQAAMLKVLSVTNLKTSTTQDFGSQCAPVIWIPENNKYSVITLSQLVDNPNIIICTIGSTKK